MSDKLYRIEVKVDDEDRRLILHIDNQSFWVGDWLEDGEDDESADELAEWLKVRLTEALDRLVVKAQNQVREADEEMKRMARQKVQEAIDVYLQGTFNIK